MHNRFYPDEQTASDSENKLLEQRVSETGTAQASSYIYLNKVTGCCVAKDELGGKMITLAGQEKTQHNGNYHLSQGMTVERR